MMRLYKGKARAMTSEPTMASTSRSLPLTVSTEPNSTFSRMCTLILPARINSRLAPKASDTERNTPIKVSGARPVRLRR
ncbi:hypothetical protein D3C86_1545630 [compost metagenome]